MHPNSSPETKESEGLELSPDAAVFDRPVQDLGSMLCDQIDSIAQSLEGVLAERDDPQLGSRLSRQLSVLRRDMLDTAAELELVAARSEALARAQADAIVNSAEIIDELEQTRQHLNEARAAAEQAASDTQRLADIIFARTNDGVLILKDELCVSCNDNVEQLLSCSPADLVGSWPRPFAQAKLADGAEADPHLRALYARAVEGETDFMEFACHNASGNVLWCEVKMTSFEMQGATHVLATVRNISSRKQFEQELRQHRDFLNNIISAVPDPLYVSDESQRLLVANESYCRSFGLPRSEVIGKYLGDIFEGEEGEQLIRSEKLAFELGGLSQEEREQFVRLGEYRTHAVRRSVFDDARTNAKYLVAISRDITHEREHQRRLNLLASVFNSAAEGVAILDPGGQILEANPRFERMFDCESVSGQLLADVIKLSISDFANELVRVSMGIPWAGKVSGTLPDGEERWYWLSLSCNVVAAETGSQIIALFSDVTQLENSQRLLQEQALHDNLTGLPNRRFFKQYLENLIKDAGEDTSFSICFMDLDDFKTVNDSMGHGSGDELLIHVSKRLKDTIGKRGFIARFGGDEFAAILPQRRQDDEAVGDSIQRLITAFQNPIQLERGEATVGLSIGIAEYPRHGATAESLMSNADIAMYTAKDAGKNHAREFSPQMQEHADQKHKIQAELRKVLKDGGLSLDFQPKVDALTGAPRGCEALCRWRKDDGSMVSPAEFIPIAEQSGVIVQLGEVVLSKTLQTCREWKDRGLESLFPVAVNISPQQLRSVRFIDNLMQLLNEHGASPDWIELEITENAVVEDINLAIDTMNRLNELGFRIAIDDFGTGYSSLSYLRFFTIDTLKIDRSFVKEVTSDRNCAAIAHSIISLGHGLDLNIVAEGVETEDQKQFLATAGCDTLQGYLFGKPMNQDGIEQWLRDRNNVVF